MNKMLAAQSDAYSLDRTCRCCLRDMTRLVSLDKVDHDIDEQFMKQTTLAELLMDFANIQINSYDGLPQKMCRKCVTALRPAFLFRQMCRESDFKLREYFGQPTTHSICVKELHFQDVDVPYESETESKFDINSFADSPFTNEQSADQKLYPVDVCPENDSEMGPDEIPVDVATIKTDLKTSDLLKDYEPNAKTSTDSNIIESKPTQTSMKSILEPIANESIVPETNVPLSAETNGKPTIYKCHLCTRLRSYTYLASYERHIARHMKAKNVICDICKKQFTMKRNLISHMESHQPDRHRQLCSLCGETFRNKFKFNAHMMYIHTGERPFKCDQCPSSFHKLANLRRHKLNHLLVKPHGCPHCEKTFVRSDKLARHIRIHTGERPFACNYCGKAFYSDTNFKAHVRIHTGEQPYQCFCGLKFSQSQQLLKHRRKLDHFDTVKQ